MELTHIKALEVINEALSRLSLTRQDHEMLVKCVQKIAELLPSPEKEAEEA